MILWLYEFLHKKVNLFGDYHKMWVVIIVFFSVLMIMGIAKPKINIIYYVVIPITAIYFGLLNKPYCYLRNIINLNISSKIFPKEKFIRIPDEWEEFGNFSLTRHNKEAIGMLWEDKIYLDEKYDFLTLWGMKEKIIYKKDFKEFLREDVRERDSPIKINKRLILRELEFPNEQKY